MKTIIRTIIAGTAALALFASGPWFHYYPKTARVTRICGDLVICEDYGRTNWSFWGREDYEVGDFVSFIMYDHFTPSIYDDEIVSVRYAGHYDLQSATSHLNNIPAKFLNR